MIVPGAVQDAPAILIDAQHFRVFLAHPGRTRTRRRRQDGDAAVFVQQVHDLIEPSKVIPAFFRFERRPGKNADGKSVAVGQPGQAHVFSPDLFQMAPLVRVVVAAVQHVGKSRDDGRVFHMGDPPMFPAGTVMSRRVCCPHQ